MNETSSRLPHRVADDGQLVDQISEFIGIQENVTIAVSITDVQVGQFGSVVFPESNGHTTMASLEDLDGLCIEREAHDSGHTIRLERSTTAVAP